MLWSRDQQFELHHLFIEQGQLPIGGCVVEELPRSSCEALEVRLNQVAGEVAPG